MAKQITQSQLEELKRFNNHLSYYSSSEYKEFMAGNVIQVLYDIDFLSVFHRKLMVEFGIYGFHRDQYDFNMISSIVSNAVCHYNKQLN
ncbi:hypothetical protein HNP38_000670 [Chryseobacterium defluvii]|uniref:Uncharacterized protein n=1 Tax=Chryseobacterium defluvii TaxID=160396 RepID=A0A840KBN3_9FLAO|nr:hypothetical protein [Chryseobacterium defluvii]MBB4805398.1 hypothetical protein [Chryseobacterium defluvii]